MKLLALLAAALVSAASHAQDYPSRPLRMIVPYPAGALTDTLARAIGERLSAALKQPVVVENKPGAGTLVGAELVARSPADGYTLLMATSTTLGISPAMYSKPAIDPVKDFAPVSLVGSVNFFLVTSPSFPPKDVREFVDLVKKNPGKFNYASSGSGSPHHLFMEVLKKEQGLDIQHVPYKGSAAAVLDIIGGKPEAMFLDFSVAVPNIKAGKIHALGTSASKQSVLMPEVPPIAATLPGFDWQAWQGVVTTGGTPPAIVARLNAEMQRFQNTEEFRALLFRFGMEPWGPNSSEQFGEIIRTDMGRWAAVVKASGAKVD
ncbi:MAG TPA: tripartite tricarboxylate transporter substrate binding protein [Burkholderiales bacterium]|jgi:tripartite-type tricarboxylate transporter receptor subunit TctC|nr:tripartite tricarboxylate transporter substrate binding protein [Burkholderiales bacterium]